MFKFKAAAIGLALATATLATTTPLIAAAHAEASIEAAQVSAGDFVRKSKRISGGWEVVQRGDQTVIVFADNFRAAGGPDLKVFLSPKTVSAVTGKTATQGSILLGELQSTRGGQEYVLPAGTNIDDFESLLVHCEAYSVLWGGGQL